MEKWQKDWILDNAKELLQLMEMKHLMLVDLMSRRILDQGDVDDLKRIKRYEGDGTSLEKSTFFTKLTGKNCFDTLIEVLEEHRLTGAADLLKAGRKTKPAEGSKKEDPNPASAEDEKFDKLIRDELNFINERDPFTVTVQEPKDKDTLPKSDYPSTAGGRRIFLLMNVIDYDTKWEKSLKKRVGAGVDTRRLKKLWEGMGWKVIVVGSEESKEHTEGGYITRQDVIDKIDEVKKICQNEWVNVDAIAVYVSSHGSQNGFYTSDGEFVHIYKDIMYQFDHKQCPRMEGKPKIFFHNACAVFSSKPEECATPDPEPRVAWDAEKVDKIADAILIRATIPGGLAYLHARKGTQLGVALTLVFMCFAWRLDFDELLKKVDHYFENKHVVMNTDNRFIQRPHQEPFWLKKFCLFPSKE